MMYHTRPTIDAANPITCVANVITMSLLCRKASTDPPPIGRAALRVFIMTAPVVLVLPVVMECKW